MRNIENLFKKRTIEKQNLIKQKKDILKLEPLAILMLKEQFVLMSEPNLYRNNHSSFNFY